MRLCDFCGAENNTDKLDIHTDDKCYNCGNNLEEKRFNKEDEVSPPSDSGESSKAFQIFVFILIFPFGLIAVLFGIYITFVAWGH